jgi:hypothetical protein
MTAATAPRRHWRSDGTEPLPAPAEALCELFSAFPAWVLRIECDRCAKVQMVNEAHARWRSLVLHPQLSHCDQFLWSARLESVCVFTAG